MQHLSLAETVLTSQHISIFTNIPEDVPHLYHKRSESLQFYHSFLLCQLCFSVNNVVASLPKILRNELQLMEGLLTDCLTSRSYSNLTKETPWLH